MLTGTLKNGFEYEIDEGALDNMELIDAMAEAQEDDPTNCSKAVVILLGKEQRDRLYDHVRKDGRVAISDVTEAFVEIFQDIGDQGKN